MDLDERDKFKCPVCLHEWEDVNIEYESHEDTDTYCPECEYPVKIIQKQDYKKFLKNIKILYR